MAVLVSCCNGVAAPASGRLPPAMGSGKRLALHPARMAAFPASQQVPRRATVRYFRSTRRRWFSVDPLLIRQPVFPQDMLFQAAIIPSRRGGAAMSRRRTERMQFDQ